MFNFLAIATIFLRNNYFSHDSDQPWRQKMFCQKKNALGIYENLLIIVMMFWEFVENCCNIFQKIYCTFVGGAVEYSHHGQDTKGSKTRQLAGHCRPAIFCVVSSFCLFFAKATARRDTRSLVWTEATVASHLPFSLVSFLLVSF